MSTQDWRARARCAGVDPELFFPTAAPGTARYEEEVAAAKAVCQVCPVRAECLSFALKALEHGVAGGLDVAERRALRVADLPAPAAVEGGAAA